MVKSYGWCYTITYRSMWAGIVFAGTACVAAVSMPTRKERMVRI